ncbi:MAG: NUDIX domain-containing protein [Bacteroidaceae bacterium]|nr:NUDIX domain-containing protein [Bacteroidaceae bacterium]
MSKTHLLDKFHYCPVCGSPRFEVNDFKSKRCLDCGFVYYLNPAGAVVALIVNERNELLVATRAEEPAKGTLDLIGGFADCGETAEQAMQREIKEETGLDVPQDSLRYLFSLPNTYLYSGMLIHTMDLFYLCRVSSQSHFIANDDVASCRWTPLVEVDPSQFGLDSIRQGVISYIQMANSKTI